MEFFTKKKLKQKNGHPYWVAILIEFSVEKSYLFSLIRAFLPVSARK